VRESETIRTRWGGAVKLQLQSCVVAPPSRGLLGGEEGKGGVADRPRPSELVHVYGAARPVRVVAGLWMGPGGGAAQLPGLRLSPRADLDPAPRCLSSIIPCSSQCLRSRRGRHPVAWRAGDGRRTRSSHPRGASGTQATDPTLVSSPHLTNSRCAQALARGTQLAQARDAAL
jgi:hypothetical protein